MINPDEASRLLEMYERREVFFDEDVCFFWSKERDSCEMF